MESKKVTQKGKKALVFFADILPKLSWQEQRRVLNMGKKIQRSKKIHNDKGENTLVIN